VDVDNKWSQDLAVQGEKGMTELTYMWRSAGKLSISLSWPLKVIDSDGSSG